MSYLVSWIQTDQQCNSLCHIHIEPKFLGLVFFLLQYKKDTILKMLKPKSVLCSVCLHATGIFFFYKTCQSKVHNNMIRKATFNTHAPQRLKSITIILTLIISSGCYHGSKWKTDICNLELDGQNNVLKPTNVKNIIKLDTLLLEHCAWTSAGQVITA